ncbi:AbrB/MazE/SpoVT family DNA-binding domain-containing protein [Candidatus Peregrinibacteria bacterium]|nr:AbrB/MazE/SpoVT family DNA-binding domain-containing protein [Candidatus Peregrinibacteria bacterium]
MTTVLSATSRGQVTLPKKWRDQFDTTHYQAEIRDSEIVLRPLNTKKSFKESIEEAWQDALKGNVISHEALMKKYGL